MKRSCFSGGSTLQDRNIARARGESGLLIFRVPTVWEVRAKRPNGKKWVSHGHGALPKCIQRAFAYGGQVELGERD